MTDRRNHERHHADQIFAAIRVLGVDASDQLFGIVEDVSNAGLRLKCHLPVRVSATLVLNVSVREHVFALRGIVRRCVPHRDGSYEIGLEFSKLERAERDVFLHAFHSATGRV